MAKHRLYSMAEVAKHNKYLSNDKRKDQAKIPTEQFVPQVFCVCVK